MADELGIQRPRFDLRTGLIGLLESRRDYARLLRNSDRLSEALRELRTKRKEEYLTLGSTAAKDLKQLQSMQKADQAMEVQAAREKRQEQSIVFRVLGDKDFNLSRVATSPDEAVKYMKGLAGENWDDSFEPFVKAKYGQELIDDARKKSDELRKEHDEQLRDKRLELAIAALARNNQKTEEQKTDAENVADAIMNGQQPPELTGLYRNSLAVRSALAKKGYNLTTAQEDWNAMKKRIATMNGAQMVRLQQAVNFTSDSLDIIEDLAHQWKAGGFPALNKARLAAAKSGALGPAAQSLATRLESQINDMVSELGTVYRGGNASTDEALRLASANLKADWSEKTLLDNIAQVRKNLRIRQNSMASAATIPGNHYAPEVQTPAPGAGDQSDPLGIRKFLPKKK
jgi:hypothetical protein